MGIGVYLLSLGATFSLVPLGPLAPFVPSVGASLWALFKGGLAGLKLSWPLLLALLGAGLSFSSFRWGMGAAILASMEGLDLGQQAQDALWGVLLLGLALSLLSNNLSGRLLLLWLSPLGGWRRWVAEVALLLAPFFIAPFLAYLAPFLRFPLGGKGREEVGGGSGVS